MIKYACVFSAFISFGVYADNGGADSKKSNAYEAQIFPDASSVFAAETQPSNIPSVQTDQTPPQCEPIIMEQGGQRYYFDDPFCGMY